MRSGIEQTKVSNAVKYIAQGRKHVSGYSYMIKDEFASLEAARIYRDQLQKGETTMPGGHEPDTRDTFSVWSYEKRSYENTFVE